MTTKNLLFNEMGAISLEEIRQEIADFRYKEATRDIIRDSTILDAEGRVFVKCAARILSNFGMTRSGPFHGVRMSARGKVRGEDTLLECWAEIKDDVVDIHDSVKSNGHSRERYILEIAEPEREALAARIWSMTKRLLPHTMGETSHGLVGASKTLFAVLPEIVLPVDNSMWLRVFQTVDLGDVIKRMAIDIQEWEGTTQLRLNDMDASGMLTTLPSVYNVVAMAARPERRQPRYLSS